jgi:hypothetical protein
MVKRLLPVVLAFLLGGVLAGGVTVAATTTSSGAKACETRSTHVLVLRHGKTCPAHAEAVTLGERGPRGPRGPIDPGHVYGQTLLDATIPASATGTVINDVFPKVPPGTYSGTLQIVNQNTSSTQTATYDVSCSVTETGPPLVFWGGSARFFDDGFSPGEITIPFVISMKKDTPILACTAGGAVTANISAIEEPVGSLG